MLKQVSRSFYLTLNVLPSDVRDEMGLAYLFARAADTIADTDLLGREQRLQYLNMFRAQFRGDEVQPQAVQAIQSALLPHQTDSAERVLLQRLPECLALFRQFDQGDRERIRWLMEVLPNGMEMDLTRFPGSSANELTALERPDELDRYTYFVAGCVGEFWTRMVCAHRPAMAHWDVDQMSTIGVRFGKGLQLTNIVKDLARDLHNGRCYVPTQWLDEVDLKPVDLLKPESLPTLRPILLRMIRQAVEHLDQGWLYTMALPRLEIRQRLACMWPILLAGETLKRVAMAPDLLNPTVNVKAPRSVVYRVMALTTFTGGCGYVGTAYWGRLRKQIV
ncbi:MAG: squalene/phytoene synthase family protein [Nitrospira sp.]|nr:squalene/phytoene synthase family protein [Nitrospira sp.]MCC7473126.1 squalene/phytoene synthase family protein [Candidatus Nomurabacteria bacterium]